MLEEYVKAGALHFPGIIFEVAELKRGSLMRGLAKAVLVTDTSGGVGLRTVT